MDQSKKKHVLRIAPNIEFGIFSLIRNTTMHVAIDSRII